MTRTLSVVAGSVLVLAAVALLLALRGARPQEPARHVGSTATPARSPAPIGTARVPSIASVSPSVRPAADAVPVSPAAIVETLEHSSDPRAIEAALNAVLTTYSSRSTRKPAPDASLEHALVLHIRSENGVLARAALSAARVPLMTEAPGAALVHAIVNTTSPESVPARRTLALEALNLLRPDRRGGLVLSAIARALSAPEPQVVSQALFALAHSGPSLAVLGEAEHSDLAQRVQALTQHRNPAIRGRSLFVFAEIADLVTADARVAEALRHLADPEPYVRAEAANLAGRCREARAIHALMPLVGDLSAARYDLAFVDIEGRASVAEHRVPGRQRVAEAALFSILALSRDTPVSSRLELTLLGKAETDARVLENAATVRAWYREVAGQIPR